MPIYVMYKGELFEVLSKVKTIEIDKETEKSFWQVLYEVEKTEAASPNDYISNFVIKSTEFYVLPSTMGNQMSEWQLGVRYGKAK